MEGSTSSGDVPKPKLNPWQKAKLQDLETSIAGPGRKRNITSPDDMEHVDLKVTITERVKNEAKGDTYIMYKICTEVYTCNILWYHTKLHVVYTNL